MSDYTRCLNQVAEQWYAMMTTAVAQSIGLAVLVAIVSILIRNRRASFRFWLWQVVALKLLALPFSLLVLTVPLLTAPVNQTRHAVDVELLPFSVSYSDSAAQMTQVPVHQESPSFIASLFLIWLSVLVIQSAWCLRRKLELNRLLAKCQTATATEQTRVEVLAARLGLSRTVRLLIGDVQIPLVTGIFRPCVLLPLGHGLSQQRFDQVILHELTHVKRNDLLWVWIPELARIVFFFHPLVYWIRYRANLCREMACDEAVLVSGVGRKEYARTLLDLAGT